MVGVFDHLLYHLYQRCQDGHRFGRLVLVGHVVGRIGFSQRLLGLLLGMQSVLGQLTVQKNQLLICLY